MTKRELVDAYVRGDLSRRQFIGKLTALGVSTTAAITYAGTLAQGAAAAPSRNGAGFVARAQDADDEYGTAITLASDEDGTVALLNAAAALDGPLTALDNFTADDFAAAGLDPADFELLLTIRDQHQEHVEALQALLGGAADDAPEGGTTTGTFETPQDLLVALAEGLNSFVAVLAAVIPALEDGEARQTATQIGLAAARQAAVVSYMAGLDPVPNTFEEVDTTVGS